MSKPLKSPIDRALADLLEAELQEGPGASLRTHGYKRAPAVLERRGQVERGHFEGGGFRMRLTATGREAAWQVRMPLNPKSIEIFNRIAHHCIRFGPSREGRLDTMGLGRIPWGLQTKGLCVVEKRGTQHVVGLTELGWKRGTIHV